MPKQKTNKAIASRMKVTGSGKLVRRAPGVGHFLSKKSSDVKRHKSRDRGIAKSEQDKYLGLLGK